MPETIKLQLTKFIKAKRTRVFEAWTDPELMRLWLAPGELRAPSATSDPVVGGRFTITMEGMMRGSFTKGVASGVYRQIVPHELIVLSWNWAGDYSPPETLITVRFRDVDGGTEVQLLQEGFADAQHKGGYEGGWRSAFEKLVLAIA